jgi:hypothetical protein
MSQRGCGVAAPFGAILRAIVTTIDEQGLKRRPMQTHAKAVTAFFDTLKDRAYEAS